MTDAGSIAGPGVGGSPAGGSGAPVDPAPSALPELLAGKIAAVLRSVASAVGPTGAPPVDVPRIEVAPAQNLAGLRVGQRLLGQVVPTPDGNRLLIGESVVFALGDRPELPIGVPLRFRVERVADRPLLRVEGPAQDLPSTTTGEASPRVRIPPPARVDGPAKNADGSGSASTNGDPESAKPNFGPAIVVDLVSNRAARPAADSLGDVGDRGPGPEVSGRSGEAGRAAIDGALVSISNLNVERTETRRAREAATGEEAARVSGGAGAAHRIELDLSTLGRVRLDFSVRASGLHLRLSAERVETVALLRTEAERLRESIGPAVPLVLDLGTLTELDPKPGATGAAASEPFVGVDLKI